jgi:uncharacterized protein YkwD
MATKALRPTPDASPTALALTEIARQLVVSSGPDVAAAVATPTSVVLATSAFPELPTETPPPTEAVSAPASEDVGAAEQYTIDLINVQRAAAALPLLARDETLMSIARARVADMTARGYTGHNDPVTGAPLAPQMMRAAGYTSPYLSENWYGSSKAPPAIVDIAMGWFMTDPPHSGNILSPNYVAVGVGIGFNGRQWLLIQIFAGANL